MSWTKERGTRNLIYGFVLILAIGFGGMKVHDYLLLAKTWPALAPDQEGLTIVGTLDAKGDYDRNLIKIVLANQTSRAELTDFGWRTIFDEKNGPMFSDSIGNTIQYARSVDSESGYALLEPYLKAALAKEMKQPDWNTIVSRDYPLTVSETHGKTTVTRQTTLGALLDKYIAQGKFGADKGEHEQSEGGSGSGRQVEHGTTIPADILAKACPVVLIGSNFTGAWLDEQPETVFSSKTYTIHLNLTPEGRSRFFQWSSKHDHESLVFVLKHRVATAGRIAQTMDVNDWSVGPIHDQEMAQAVVDYVNSQAKR
ncbi:MAG TPA: hypothetical protein VKU00_32900 [Chthonomonadaceae bacterium]|nr:hypothetical protein [Chthonomonadaceae bacterium]